MRWLHLSHQGKIDLVKGCILCAIQNFTLMFPVGLIYSFMMYLLSGDNSSGIIYLGLCVLCAVLILIATYFQYNATFLATYQESGRRRVSLAERLRKIPLSFFSHKDLADLTASIMDDCAKLETSQSHFVAPLIGSIISTSVIALSLFIVDSRMALAALWVLPVAFGIVGFSARVQEGFSRRSLSARVSCEEGVQEFLECAKDLRSNNYTSKYLEGLTEKVKLVESRAMSSELGTAIFVVSAYLVLKIGIASVALTGAVLYSRGSLSVPVFLLFLLTASRLYDPLEVSLQNLAAIISARSSAGRLTEIYSQALQTGSETLSNNGYDVEFRNVSFGYDGAGTVLHDVSFTARQGEVTALVGPSGGGKTTASRLIMRFWDIQQGKILIGGMDISEIDPEALMSLCSVVFQDVILFNNSILENIRIGRKNATDEECIAAGRLANCEEFAERLPDRWNSLIGENGCELSGGERQRISIARAFLKDAPIILLDEATASLDAENEGVIQSALSRLIRNKTVIVIAHRMRTVMGADKVIVLSGGSVAEQGSPEELLRMDGIFANMVKLQRGE